MESWAFILRIIKLKVCLFTLKLPRVHLTQWKIRVMGRAQSKKKAKTSNTNSMIIALKIRLFSKILHKIQKKHINQKSSISKVEKDNNYKSLYQMPNLLNKSFNIQIPWEIRWIYIAKRRNQVLYLILMGLLPNRNKSKLKDIVLTKLIKEFRPRMLQPHRIARTTKRLLLPIANMVTIE